MNKGYFQPQQARDVAKAFAKHHVEYLFIGKSGAILLGYPSTTQDVDLFPKKSEENCTRLIVALKEIGFQLSASIEEQILKGVDFVQINQDPFDLDLIFAPDGIDSFEIAKERMILIEDFPVANIRDIIASKRASGREKAIKFVGIDALPHEGVMYVKQGILDATFQYPTGGAEAIDTAIRILNGEKVPKEITLGSRLFTRENVDKGGEPIR